MTSIIKVIDQPSQGDLERLAFLLCELDSLHHQADPTRFQAYSINQRKTELLNLIREGHVYCAKQDSQIIAFASVIPKEGYVLIEHLFVDPLFRRKKVATLLIDRICKDFMNKELRVSVYAFNTEAIAFYERAFALSSLIFKKRLL